MRRARCIRPALELDRPRRRPDGDRPDLDVVEPVSLCRGAERLDVDVVGLERDDEALRPDEACEGEREEADVGADVPDDRSAPDEAGQPRLQLRLDLAGREPGVEARVE